MSLEEVTTGMRERVGENAGLDATVKFDFGDDGLVFLDGKSVPNSVSNEDAEADCTLSISIADFKSMASGELDPTTAFMMGKLKVDGDMTVAFKLQKVF
ncbi:MAG: SCP2 sterol-binding domain-containing protein [Alphaproteobacteria bacterium]|jgi:putative sterol carrier protein|nr:SCP2 sterol-binding domain-containing protein [Alphaproteobacteria bacterium]|tara:strand:+ start:1444 stop:1740 length:297 start_codon:yes stop_codon:yes gene_type:complete